jgi:hypothetical protein
MIMSWFVLAAGQTVPVRVFRRVGRLVPKWAGDRVRGEQPAAG